MSWAIWITGLPGSGKSAIARAAVAELAARGERVEHLELDVLRRTLTPVPTYDAAERDAVYRALVLLARTLTRAGQPVLIDATGHRRGWRDLARACIGDFAEVQLVCPLEVARERERVREPGHHPRAIYARAGRPGAAVPGVDVAYEPALAPELTIDTTQESVESAGARVAALARSFGRNDAVGWASGASGWALWISGRPGSGKTTLTSAVCERLSGMGTPATVVDAGVFADFIGPGGPLTDAQRDIAMRAVVEVARRLHDLGMAVIIDGTTRLGDGGRLARELIDVFAQVELVCPPEICRMRERAVRWQLVACPSSARPTAGPDLGLGYESTTCPDLMVFTDVVDERVAAAEILYVVERLERSARHRRRPCA